MGSNRVAWGVKATAVILAVITLYHQDLIILASRALQSELMSYILAIPPLLAFLVYRKRRMLRAVVPSEASTHPRRRGLHETVGALLCLLAFLLYWHGSYTFSTIEYHTLSLPLFAAGLILIIFNPETLRVLAFPLAFLLLLMPPPLLILYSFGATLSTISSEAAYRVVKAIVDGLIHTYSVSLENQYGTPAIIIKGAQSLPLILTIDIACAGIYSLMGFAIFAVFVAYIARGAWWRKAIMFSAGFLLIYALNILRIVVIVLIGSQYGMEAAMQAFHLMGGWVLIFLGTTILLSLSEKIGKIQIFTAKAAPCPTCSQSLERGRNFCLACGKILRHIDLSVSKRDLLKIAVILMIVGLITLIEAPLFALTEGPAQIIIPFFTEEEPTEILPEISAHTIRFVYRDRGFERIAGQDASLMYAYIPVDRSPTWIYVLVEVSSLPLHAWEVCLHGVTWLDLRDIQLSQNPPITGRFAVAQHYGSNLTRVILYWYEKAFFRIGLDVERRNVKMSLVIFTYNPQDYPKLEELLLPLATAIVNHWQSVKTLSPIAVVAQRVPMTAAMAATTTLLAILLLPKALKRRERGKSAMKAYKNLALEEERTILQALHQAARGGGATVNAIASSYQKVAGKTIELELLLDKLNEAEKAGLVKREIANLQDAPILVWKSQIPSKTYESLL